MKIQSEWRMFLREVEREFRDSKRPLSKEILKNRLSMKFNLSPDFCSKVVDSLYK